jgi:hypothetical protein
MNASCRRQPSSDADGSVPLATTSLTPPSAVLQALLQGFQPAGYQPTPATELVSGRTPPSAFWEDTMLLEVRT